MTVASNRVILDVRCSLFRSTFQDSRILAILRSNTRSVDWTAIARFNNGDAGEVHDLSVSAASAELASCKHSSTSRGQNVAFIEAGRAYLTTHHVSRMLNVECKSLSACYSSNRFMFIELHRPA